MALKKKTKKITKKLPAKKKITKKILQKEKTTSKKLIKSKSSSLQKEKTTSKKSIKSKPSSLQKEKQQSNLKTHLTKNKTSNSKISRNKISYLNDLENELESILEKNKSVQIKDSEGHAYCLEENCDQNSTTMGYCRYHYMVSWLKIKNRDDILNTKKLDKWIKEIILSHSPKILDFMMRDLSNEKDFSTALTEMTIPKIKTKT